jgi:hypothetical protein
MASPTGRAVLESAALATTRPAMLLVCGVHAAGGDPFRERWTPGAKDTMTGLCNEWAENEKVGTTFAFISTQGDKVILSAAVEAQAKSEHDISSILTWHCPQNGKPINKVADWAASEIAGSMRM